MEIGADDILSPVFLFKEVNNLDSLGLLHICFTIFGGLPPTQAQIQDDYKAVMRELDQGIPDVDSLVAGRPDGKHLRLQLWEEAWLILPLPNLHVK